MREREDQLTMLETLIRVLFLAALSWFSEKNDGSCSLTASSTVASEVLYRGSNGERGRIGSGGTDVAFDTCRSLLGLVIGLEGSFLPARAATAAALLDLNAVVRGFVFDCASAFLVFGPGLVCDLAGLTYLTLVLLVGAVFFVVLVVGAFLDSPFSRSCIGTSFFTSFLTGVLRWDLEGVSKP